MVRWWEQDATRWDREKKALADSGIVFSEVQAALREGRLVLDLKWVRGEETLNLQAHYPPAYPYFPPTVIASELNLARHQTPGSKNLCLLSHGGEEWNPATDTLAGLITEQLPKVLAAQPGGDHENEHGQEAEPVTAFLLPEPNSFVGFPAYEFEKLPASGTFRIGLESLSPLRGTVVEVLDDEGRSLFSSEARTRDQYSAGKLPVVIGRWVRLEQRPEFADAKSYYQLAGEHLAGLAQPQWQDIPSANKGRIDVVALLFPDELVWKTDVGNAILVSKSQYLGKDGKRSRIEPKLHRVELESRSLYFARDPAASGLQRGCVVQAGLGSIGSPAAKLLAQGGIGELRLLDQDVVDVGNAIRWETGRSVAGYQKAAVMQEIIRANFPYTRIAAAAVSIGDTHHSNASTEQELHRLLFEKVDCLFDATASTLVNNYLSSLARSRGIPYVWMYATHGGWAGLVGRAGTKRSDFCWMCHLYYLDESRPGAAGIPPLPTAPTENAKPVGCLHPTFVGAQVDLSEVSLMGVRLVTDEVLTRAGAQVASAYDWNVAVLHLRDGNGQPQLPTWVPYVLPPHESCPNH